MASLVRARVERCEAFLFEDGDVGQVVFQFAGHREVHRFFLDAFTACWEELALAEATEDFVGLVRVDVDVEGATVTSARCVREARADVLLWSTSRGTLRMRFEDPNDGESRTVFEHDGRRIRPATLD